MWPNWRHSEMTMNSIEEMQAANCSEGETTEGYKRR